MEHVFFRSFLCGIRRGGDGLYHPILTSIESKIFQISPDIHLDKKTIKNVSYLVTGVNVFNVVQTFFSTFTKLENDAEEQN